jgi:hypothetical protein
MRGELKRAGQPNQSTFCQTSVTTLIFPSNGEGAGPVV